MTLLTAAQAQSLGVGIGLVPADLQRVIDAEESELVRRFGDPTAALTETLRPRDANLYLKRRPATITSVQEYLFLGDTAPAHLAATDYEVWTEEARLERISTACRWGAKVVITYTPADDRALRKSVLLELTRIAVESAGSSGAGGGSVSGLGYSVSGGGGGATDFHAARQAQYRRMGWLS